jgi:hypothetical protein
MIPKSMPSRKRGGFRFSEKIMRRQRGEPPMRVLLPAALATFLLGLALPDPAAAIVRPWCEWSSVPGSGPDCSYWTFRQCLQTARGDGSCVRNPQFDWPYFQRGQIPPVDTDYYGRPLRAPRQ